VNHARAGDLHLDPVVDPFAPDVGHGAPLDAANHHAGLGIIEDRAVFVGADLGEQLRVDLRQVHILALRFPAPQKVPHGALRARPDTPLFVRREPHFAALLAARKDRHTNGLLASNIQASYCKFPVAA